MVSDYKAVRALNLFPARDFNILDDYDAKKIHKWCVEVHIADFWDLFKAKDNETSEQLVRLLKYHFRQALAKGFVLQENQKFSLGFNDERLHLA